MNKHIIEPHTKKIEETTKRLTLYYAHCTMLLMALFKEMMHGAVLYQ